MRTYRSSQLHLLRINQNHTHPVYRILDYSLGTLLSVLLDEHTGIHHRQSNIRTWHTTSIPAFDVNCTHARTRKHHPSYRDHGASVCRQSPDVLFRAGARELALVVGNFGLKELYGGEDNVEDREDIQQQLMRDGKFGHLQKNEMPGTKRKEK
jgi:hypothetical protein